MLHLDIFSSLCLLLRCTLLIFISHVPPHPLPPPLPPIPQNYPTNPPRPIFLSLIHEAAVLQIVPQYDVLTSIKHDLDVLSISSARDVVVDDLQKISVKNE